MRVWIVLALAVTWGCSGPEQAGDPRAEEAVAPVATFTHPQPLAYVWWSLPADEPLRVLEVPFTLPANYTAEDGVYLAVAQGKLRAPGGAEVAFRLGLHSQLPGRGRGGLFSRPADDVERTRKSASGWAQVDDGEAQVGTSFPWKAGAWTARLEFRRTKQSGTWYGVVFLHEASGDLYDAGELCFPSGAAIQPVVGGCVELTAGASVAADVAPWELELAPPRGNGHPPRAATTAYGELPNVDLRLDPRSGRVHVRFGGELRRRHAAGSFPLPDLR